MATSFGVSPAAVHATQAQRLSAEMFTGVRVIPTSVAAHLITSSMLSRQNKNNSKKWMANRLLQSGEAVRFIIDAVLALTEQAWVSIDCALRIFMNYSLTEFQPTDDGAAQQFVLADSGAGVDFIWEQKKLEARKILHVKCPHRPLHRVRRTHCYISIRMFQTMPRTPIALW